MPQQPAELRSIRGKHHGFIGTARTTDQARVSKHEECHLLQNRNPFKATRISKSIEEEDICKIT
jgi:hypothetical protein